MHVRRAGARTARALGVGGDGHRRTKRRGLIAASDRRDRGPWSPPGRAARKVSACPRSGRAPIRVDDSRPGVGCADDAAATLSVHDVAVIGGGVVGAAVALALARRGAATVLLEAAPELALGASGTNSGILHTGFDAVPGELETALILRSSRLRSQLVDALGVPVLRCGA